MPVVVSGAAGLLGVYVGGFVAQRNEARRRRLEFITKQLTDFYGPLVGLKADIEARAYREGFVSAAAAAMWEARLLDVSDPVKRESILAAKSAEIEGLQGRYFAAQRDEVLPMYREMKRIFSEGMWLADSSTTPFYRDLCDHIDSLDQLLNLRLAYETLLLVGPQDFKLNKFYLHLDAIVESLKSEIGHRAHRMSGRALQRTRSPRRYRAKGLAAASPRRKHER